VAPAAPTAPGAPTATTATPTTPHVPEPFDQSTIQTLVTSAHSDQDGTQTLTLRLRPDDLGSVDVSLEVKHGVVNLTMSASSAGARDALNDHVSDLRSALADAGLTLGSVDIGAGGQESAQAQQAADAAAAGADGATEPSPLTATDLHL
jgi:flagellar hook-length control protein FliK